MPNITRVVICDGCKWSYPDGLVKILYAREEGKTVCKDLCGICALNYMNEKHGENRKKFDGEEAEAIRKDCITWRKLNKGNSIVDPDGPKNAIDLKVYDDGKAVLECDICKDREEFKVNKNTLQKAVEDDSPLENPVVREKLFKFSQLHENCLKGRLM